MPILVHRCLAEGCGIEFEAILILKEDWDAVCCPRCESKRIEWVPATFAMKIKEIMQSYRGPCSNPYEGLTLQHVRDKENKPITVNSLKELRVAEKEHQFVHAFSAADRQESIDTPPQHESWAGDLAQAAKYQWKWARDPKDRARVMASDVVTVDVGNVASAKDTLIGAEL